MLTFKPEQLHVAATKIFRAAGASEENARIVVDHLIDANLCGHDSHGVIRIPSYVQSIKRDQLDPAATPATVRETAAMTLIDANRTFGQVSALVATDAVVKKAREHGVAIAGTIRGNHIGRVGYYPTRAAQRGVALLVAYGTLGSSGAPFGGRKGALGTNPISFGFPSGGDTPFLLDFATTAIAAGKVSVARDKHEPLPPNSAIDKDGNPTTDPHAVAQGALLPFGGHKGYALSLMSALLSRALIRSGDDRTGEGGAGKPHGGAGADAGVRRTRDEGAGQAKVFFCAIDTSVFGEGAGAEAERIFEKMRATPPAAGFESVLIPGEPEARTAAKRQAEGVPVAEDTWASITKTAAELDVTL
ncbi:MAG TPA: Ldh family oxidoreductase [Chloroflexota bacterium]|nr:Ldh family oxidoreductase [Chloroflexota bacterium]